jgi:hypothetical protein
MIDVDTPKDVHESTAYADGSPYVLVFSDEFNVDGRTFYPGDDPYWEAVDLHYWQVNVPSYYFYCRHCYNLSHLGRPCLLSATFA